MNKLLSAVILGSAVIGLAPLSVGAAPIAPRADGAQSSVEKVHGYHRGCRGGPSWRHRHQRDGDRVRCGGYHYRYYSQPGVTLHFGTRHHHDRGRRHHRRHHD